MRIVTTFLSNQPLAGKTTKNRHHMCVTFGIGLCFDAEANQSVCKNNNQHMSLSHDYCDYYGERGHYHHCVTSMLLTCLCIARFRVIVIVFHIWFSSPIKQLVAVGCTSVSSRTLHHLTIHPLTTMASTTFSESNLVRKLEKVVNTQDSIQSLSFWILHHKSHCRQIIYQWFKCYHRGLSPTFPLSLHGTDLHF